MKSDRHLHTHQVSQIVGQCDSLVAAAIKHAVFKRAIFSTIVVVQITHAEFKESVAHAKTPFDSIHVVVGNVFAIIALYSVFAQ